MIEKVKKRLNEPRMIGYTNQWLNERLTACVHDYMKEWVNGQLNEWMDIRMHHRINE